MIKNPEDMLIEILENGEDIDDPIKQTKWMFKALKALAYVSLDTRKDVKSIRMIIKILAYAMLPIVASLIGAIITLLR